MTEHYKGYTVTLEYDHDADNPLDWMAPTERGAWFALQHRRYSLPWELEDDHDQYTNWRDVAERNADQYGGVCKFVRWHEHSGNSVSLVDSADGADDWDAGVVGVVIGESVATIQQAFAPWAAYVAGEVYTLTVAAPDGTRVCTLGGMYGYSWTMNWARRVIDEDAQLTGVARIRRYGRAHAPRAQEVHA